ncbi:MAG: RNA polymerase sigma factor [Acidimicrobiales bacterium]
MTDEEVIARSSSEPETFGLLFDRHFDTIARFCIRRVGTVQGENLAGDVFQWAFENRSSFDPHRGTARSWLFRIANNHVRNAQRSSGRQGLAYLRWWKEEERPESDPAAEVVVAVAAANDLCAVAAALELQPAEDVETLLLFAWEELSYAEIAGVLSIPLGTVRSRINRVRHRLHDILDGELVQTECPTRLLGGLP